MKSICNKILLTLVCIFLTGTALTASEMVKQINIAAKSETNHFYLVFCARGGLPTGHVFVAWGKDSFNVNACQDSAYGLYPEDRAVGLDRFTFGPVPGKIVAESLASEKEYRLIVQVDSTQFAAAEAVRKEKWSEVLENKYELLVSDCAAYVSDIAGAIHLKRPERAEYMLPVSFVKEMMKLNQ